MNEPAAGPPRRARVALVPTLAAVAGIAVCIAAGNWQRDRMEQKLSLRAQLDAANAAPAVALPQVTDWPAWRYRTVVANGTFDAQRQFLLDNKVRGGRAGYEVVAPLALPDGRVVLVNRGWTPAGATRADLPSVPPPAGPVRVQGRLNIPPAGYLELAAEAAPGAVWQNLDPARFAQATGVAVLPVVIEQAAAEGGKDALVREWPAPDFGVDKHRIYMLQWYAFAATAAALWLYFTFRRRP
ncbi:MAG: SURF1 family protein [Betaproteobacteria bacterium]|nr:SURF1 family protein [Betaproteobacteria bacterium]